MASSDAPEASSSSSYVASSFSSLSSSESAYSSLYGLEDSGNYTVADGGTASVNGTYAPYDTSDGVTSYKKTDANVYMYRYDDTVDKWWIIGTVHGQEITGAQTLYDDLSASATPPLGQWSTTYGYGDAPDPTIAEA